MCATYLLKSNSTKILKLFNLQRPDWLQGEIDIRPQGFLKTDLAPVIFQNADGNLEIKEMNFSLCPSWSKEFPAKFTTYNARLERPHPKLVGKIEPIYEVPTWKDAFINGQTCLVPMTSAIESSYFGKSAGKIVGFHRKDNEVFYATGLWNEWINKESGEVHDTFTLITDDPYQFFFDHGHDRSVFVIKPEAYNKWLTGKNMSAEQRFDFLRENRVSLEWDVTTDREMKEGWSKRAPKPDEIESIKIWPNS